MLLADRERDFLCSARIVGDWRTARGQRSACAGLTTMRGPRGNDRECWKIVFVEREEELGRYGARKGVHEALLRVNGFERLEV
jgi:hypothetical protein